MRDEVRAVLATVLVLAAAAVGIRSVVLVMQQASDLGRHLRMARQLTFAVLLLFVGIAVFLNDAQAVYCAPAMVLLVWLQYGVARWHRALLDAWIRRNRK